MTLEQLRLFVAVAEAGGVTRAGVSLGLTQSAVSASIAALEARHGVLLFDRIGRGVALSEAGKAFLPEARAVLEAERRASLALREMAGLARGELRLAASQTVAHYWAPERLAAFAEAHPGLKIDMVVGNTQSAAEAVVSGAVELALVEGETDHPALSRRPVGLDALSLYCDPANPLAQKGVVIRDDLAAARWVMREKGSGTRSELEAALEARGLNRTDLKILLEFPSTEAVLSALTHSNTLAAASDLAAAPLVALGRIVRLPFALVQRRYDLLTHRQRSLSRAAEAFVAEQLSQPAHRA